MTANEIRALVVLINAEAERQGKPWPAGGIHAAVERQLHAGRRAEDVLRAALTDARDPARTGMTWALEPPRGTRCTVCGHPESACRRVNALVAPENRHEFTPKEAE